MWGSRLNTSPCRTWLRPRTNRSHSSSSNLHSSRHRGSSQLSNQPEQRAHRPAVIPPGPFPSPIRWRRPARMRSRRPSPPPPRRREPSQQLLSRAAIIADRRRIPPPRRRRQCRPPPITPPPIWEGRRREAHRRRLSPPPAPTEGRLMAGALRHRAEPTRPTGSSRPAPTPDIRRREGRREAAAARLRRDLPDILAIRLRPPVRDIPEDRPRSAAILLVGLLVIPADRYRRPPAVLLLPGTQQAERPSPGDLLRPLPDIRLRAEHLPPKLCCIMYIVVKYRTVSCRYSFYRRS
jgi:hypothetical protein